MSILIAPLLHGFLLSLAMIMAIGAQNIFILKQGISGQHVMVACCICAFCDAALIILGALGFGSYFATYKLLQITMCALGAAFLLWYGYRAFNQFLHNKSQKFELDSSSLSLRSIIFTGLAFSVLNPHAWIDTVMVIGSVSSQYDEQSSLLAFTFGACLVSFMWFFLLAFLAGKFRHVLQKARVQKGLNLFIAVLMTTISLSLLRHGYSLL